MFAHDILRATLATSSPSPASAEKQKHFHHHHHHHQQQQQFMSDSDRAAFSPSTTASTVARAGDGVSCAFNLLGSFNSTTGDYSPPPPNQGGWAAGRDSHGMASLRSDGNYDASSRYSHDDHDAGYGQGAREEVRAHHILAVCFCNTLSMYSLRRCSSCKTTRRPWPKRFVYFSRSSPSVPSLPRPPLKRAHSCLACSKTGM
jgi:hypothetical protein